MAASECNVAVPSTNSNASAVLPPPSIETDRHTSRDSFTSSGLLCGSHFPIE